LFDSNSWTFAKAFGKSGGFSEKRVSEIDPDINIRKALLLIVLFVSLEITLSFRMTLWFCLLVESFFY